MKKKRNFLYENYLPKDLKRNLRSAASSKPSHVSPFRAIFNNLSMRESSFKQINSANHQKIQKTAHKGLFCSLRIQLQQLFTSRESIVLKSPPAVVVLYCTASENENSR